MTDSPPATRIVVLASGSGSNLQAVLDACDDGRLDAEVVAVVSDRPGARALDRARRRDIPAVALPVDGRLRPVYDAHLASVVARYQPDWIVLAGWMRILTMSFLGRFPNRVVNLHPALPGSFPGTKAIERAWEAGRRGEIQRTGAMVHLVPDEGVDDGPVVAVREVPLVEGESLEALTARMHAAEHQLLVEALALLTDPADAGAPRT